MITALALVNVSLKELVTDNWGGKAAPANRAGLGPLLVSSAASGSVRAHSLTSSPLRASTIPSVIPQVVVPMIAILGIAYPAGLPDGGESIFSACSPSLRSLPEINRLILSRCITIITTVPIKV